MSALPTHMMSGRTPACSQANSVPGAAEARWRSRRATSSSPCASHSSRRSAQARRVVEPHAARALDDRLDDDAGAARRAWRSTSASQVRRRQRVVEHRAAARSAKTCSASAPREQRVHPADRVADRHRAERVAVVAAADGEQPRRRPGPRLQAILIATSTATEPESAKNTCSQRRGRQLDEPLRPGATAGSCVRPPNMTCAMRSSCSCSGGVERGVAVAVDRRTTTTPCRRSARGRRPAAAARPRRATTGSGAAASAGIGPYGCHTWRAVEIEDVGPVGHVRHGRQDPSGRGSAGGRAFDVALGDVQAAGPGSRRFLTGS